jgi:hypothetical protein
MPTESGASLDLSQIALKLYVAHFYLTAIIC